jgi:hypothetical protein
MAAAIAALCGLIGGGASASLSPCPAVPPDTLRAIRSNAAAAAVNARTRQWARVNRQVDRVVVAAREAHEALGGDDTDAACRARSAALASHVRVLRSARLARDARRVEEAARALSDWCQRADVP